jgi:hypothetical protein
MISMFLSLTSLSDENKLFDGQLYVQWALIAVAVIAVPWMLLLKPYYLKHKYQSKLRSAPTSVTEDDDEAPEVSETFVLRRTNVVVVVVVRLFVRYSNSFCLLCTGSF